MGALAFLLLLGLLKGVDVSVTTTDGETIEGKVSLTALKLKTDFGTATVKAERLAQITFGQPDVVVTKGDYELRGEIALSSLKIDTGAGSRTLKRGQIASLVVIEEGGSRGATFDGEWMATYGGAQGPMKLQQSGLRVTGTYGHSGEFSIEGKVKGNTLTFTTREGNSGGKGTAELWKDGSVFMGTVDYGRGELPMAAYRKQPRDAPAKPGEITVGQSKAGLEYFLRVPKDYDPKRTYPAVFITHGSNANSEGYVATFPARWPQLAEELILVGVNGERLSPGSKPGNVGHNASYVNFSGPEVGQPWAYRQTPALLAETVTELKERLPIGKVLLGGHSQGGFLTYATFLYYPELFDGAFPMSCNLLVQCEPDQFRDPKLVARQHEVAVAPIHGQADNVVEFDSGEYCFLRMQESGFPRLHFFAPKGLGHAFMYLPVEEAIRWLLVMTSDDPSALAHFAESCFKDGQYRDATGALLRARELDKAGALSDRLADLEKKIDARAEPAAKKLEKAIAENRNNKWVDDFWEFRRDFAGAPAAEKCLAAYAKLREKHTEPANKLFWEARNERDEKARMAKYREIYESYYASGWWILVKKWVK